MRNNIISNNKNKIAYIQQFNMIIVTFIRSFAQKFKRMNVEKRVVSLQLAPRTNARSWKNANASYMYK